LDLQGYYFSIMRNICLYVFVLILLANFNPSSQNLLAAGPLKARILPGGISNGNCATPPNFPTSIPLTQQTFKNWADDIIVSNLWTATPNTAQDVVTIANWASANNYNVRASGYMHNWSPLTVTPTTTCSGNRILLVKTAEHLTSMEIVSESPAAAVKVQTGASMESLLTFLEENGYGVLASPAPGDLTVGGALAINGHGTGVPAVGETLTSGHTYGSLSNLIVAFTAVAWDAGTGKYALRSFDRSNVEAKAFLTHLGRAFLTDVTLRVGANYNLRCQSFTNVPASELFAPSGPRTLASYLDSAGRVETIMYPFTDKPWLKVWTVTPNKPLTSRAVTAPFNYPFTDNVPEAVSVVAAQVVSGVWSLAPTLGATEYTATVTGLAATNSADLWGPSKNLLMYIKPTTLRVTANGYAVITTRANVQPTVSSFVSFYENLLAEYQDRGEFPVNGPLEIRVTGVDSPADVGVTGAEAPAISALRPVQGHPELNSAVWFDILTFPQTPLASEFMRDLEEYLMGTIHDGVTTVVRPEWSKGWAYTTDAPWANTTFMTSTVPSLFPVSSTDGWAWTVNTMNKYDPKKVFSNEFLRSLLV
jgi:FAD/FMN-containing dehydrogenase